MERIELEVFASNARAIALYESLGFMREGLKRRTRKLDDAYDDDLVMALLLDSRRPDFRIACLGHVRPNGHPHPIHPVPGPAYRIQTPRLVIRCWQPADAPLLADAVTASLEHLRPWMPWVHAEPEELEAKVQRLRGFRAQLRPGRGLRLRDLHPGRARGGRRHGAAPARGRGRAGDRLLDQRAARRPRIRHGGVGRAHPRRVRGQRRGADGDPLRSRQRAQRGHPPQAGLHAGRHPARQRARRGWRDARHAWCGRCSAPSTPPRPPPPRPCRRSTRWGAGSSSAPCRRVFGR